MLFEWIFQPSSPTKSATEPSFKSLVADSTTSSCPGAISSTSILQFPEGCRSAKKQMNCQKFLHVAIFSLRNALGIIFLGSSIFQGQRRLETSVPVARRTWTSYHDSLTWDKTLFTKTALAMMIVMLTMLWWWWWRWWRWWRWWWWWRWRWWHWWRWWRWWCCDDDDADHGDDGDDGDDDEDDDADDGDDGDDDGDDVDDDDDDDDEEDDDDDENDGISRIVQGISIPLYLFF